jgi:hypothetical protein
MAYMNRIKNLLALGAAALLLMSCNYSIRPEPAVSSLSIGHIDNRTREPKLSDSLREELTRELASRSIRVAVGLDNEITGTIKSLEVNPLAERGGTIVKFSVSIRGDFILKKGPEDRPVKLLTPLSYIVAFGSDAPLDSLYSMREEAVHRAVADLAADLAAAAAINR